MQFTSSPLTLQLWPAVWGSVLLRFTPQPTMASQTFASLPQVQCHFFLISSPTRWKSAGKNFYQCWTIWGNVQNWTFLMESAKFWFLHIPMCSIQKAVQGLRRKVLFSQAITAAPTAPEPDFPGEWVSFQQLDIFVKNTSAELCVVFFQDQELCFSCFFLLTKDKKTCLFFRLPPNSSVRNWPQW